MSWFFPWSVTIYLGCKLFPSFLMQAPNLSSNMFNIHNFEVGLKYDGVFCKVPNFQLIYNNNARVFCFFLHRIKHHLWHHHPHINNNNNKVVPSKVQVCFQGQRPDFGVNLDLINKVIQVIKIIKIQKFLIWQNIISKIILRIRSK